MSQPQKDFLEKIAFNLFKTWREDYQYDNYIKRLLGSAWALFGGSINGGEWSEKIEAKRQRALVAKKKRGSKMDIDNVPMRDYLTPDDIAETCSLIIDRMPQLTNEFTVERNVEILADLLDLKYAEKLMLQLAIYSHDNGMIYPYADVFQAFSFAADFDDPQVAYKAMFDLTDEEASTLNKGFLFNAGMMTRHKRLNFVHCLVEQMGEAFIKVDCLTAEGISESLFPSCLTTDLDPAMFPHCSKEIARTEAVISRSLANKAMGVNVMFWGLAGTGKTELSLALAEKNGWNLKIIGDISTSDTTEKSRAQRIASLQIAMKLYQNSENVVLLFDEMEDLFKSDQYANFSKAFVNRIIETSPVPIIWTTNNLEIIGSPVLRRMTYNIGFHVPPESARRTMWKTYAAKYEVDVPEKTILELSRNYDIVPALISNAMKIAKLADLQNSEISDIVQSLDRLVNLGEKRRFSEVTRKSTPYNTRWAKADVDLTRLSDRLMTADSSFSVCCYGVSGTGKSEWGRYVAERIDKRVLYKRASDLISMWVGQTEANIAAAFEQARDEEMMLIIDEGDTFLRDRKKARQSWEVIQTNEMLSQMENHNQPFILTTNLMQDIDESALRRFTFKIKFDYLETQQARDIFKAYFDCEAPNEIRYNDFLSPGDFLNVKKMIAITGETSPDEIYALLQAETKLKSDAKKSRIGF